MSMPIHTATAHASSSNMEEHLMRQHVYQAQEVYNRLIRVRERVRDIGGKMAKSYKHMFTSLENDVGEVINLIFSQRHLPVIDSDSPVDIANYIFFEHAFRPLESFQRYMTQFGLLAKHDPTAHSMLESFWNEWSASFQAATQEDSESEATTSEVSSFSEDVVNKLQHGVGDTTVADLIATMPMEELVARLTASPVDSSEETAEAVVEVKSESEVDPDADFTFEGYYPVVELEKVIASLNQVTPLLDEANKALSLYDRETQDYLHALELLDLDQYTLEDVVFRLSEARKKRRNVQNFIRLCEPLNDLVTRHSTFLQSAIKTKATLVKMRRGMSSRRYSVREASDLQPLFDALFDSLISVGDGEVVSFTDEDSISPEALSSQ